MQVPFFHSCHVFSLSEAHLSFFFFFFSTAVNQILGAQSVPDLKETALSLHFESFQSLSVVGVARRAGALHPSYLCRHFDAFLQFMVEHLKQQHLFNIF